LHNRITAVENHLKEVYSHLTGYTRRLVKLKEDANALANVINKFGQEETVNSSLKCTLIHLAESLSSIQDYRNVQVI